MLYSVKLDTSSTATFQSDGLDVSWTVTVPEPLVPVIVILVVAVVLITVSPMSHAVFCTR